VALARRRSRLLVLALLVCLVYLAVPGRAHGAGLLGSAGAGVERATQQIAAVPAAAQQVAQTVQVPSVAQAPVAAIQAASGDAAANAGAIAGTVQKTAAPVTGAVARAAPIVQRVHDALPEAAGGVARSLGPAGGAVSKVVETTTTTVQGDLPPTSRLTPPGAGAPTPEGPRGAVPREAPAAAHLAALSAAPTVPAQATAWQPTIGFAEPDARNGARLAGSPPCSSCTPRGVVSAAAGLPLGYDPFALGAVLAPAAGPDGAPVRHGNPVERHAPAPAPGPGGVPAPSFAPAGGGTALVLALICIALLCMPALTRRLRPTAGTAFDARHVLVLERPG
jgi:hypothetical protein